MRVRFDKNAADFLNEENIHINNSKEYKGKWKNVFLLLLQHHLHH